MDETTPHPPLSFSVGNDGSRLTLEGTLGISTLSEAKNYIEKWRPKQKERLLDLAKLSDLDTPGALCCCAAFATRASN